MKRQNPTNLFLRMGSDDKNLEREEELRRVMLPLIREQLAYLVIFLQFPGVRFIPRRGPSPISRCILLHFEALFI